MPQEKYPTIKGGVTAPKGFEAAGFHAGIKSKDGSKDDIALIYSNFPAQVAGVFTKNKFAAAPVIWCRKLLLDNKVRAIVANSGNANACTGDEGMASTEKMADYTAKLLDLNKEQVLVSSTGVIGQQLPMPVVLSGIDNIVKNKSQTKGPEVAEAILTTDTFKKEIAIQYEYDNQKIILGGCAKGSGMIHPDMATMLGYITTDAAIEQEALQEALRKAADLSFNMISVDRDTSTNDSLICLANGEADNQIIKLNEPGYKEFFNALLYICTYLAKQIAEDGEGATKFLEINLKGAPTENDARIAAKSVISSNLVKAAFFGEDANWGRIVCALGYSGAEFDIEKVDVNIESSAGKEEMMLNGTPLDFSEEKAAKILHEKYLKVNINLNSGKYSATAWGCDLSYDYVKINGDYRT